MRRLLAIPADSAVGRGLGGAPIRLTLALAVAGVAVFADFVAMPMERRLQLVAAATAAIALLCRADIGTLGLRIRPAPSVRYWIVATLAIGAVIGLISASVAGVAWLAGWLDTSQPPIYGSVDQFYRDLWGACVIAPVHEELLYRLVLCVPLVALIGRWPTVVVSGIIFGYLHIHYGVPGPNNLIAGFFFAWAYLVSSSVFVPMALHALGNLCVAAINLTHFYVASG